MSPEQVLVSQGSIVYRAVERKVPLVCNLEHVSVWADVGRLQIHVHEPHASRHVLGDETIPFLTLPNSSSIRLRSVMSRVIPRTAVVSFPVFRGSQCSSLQETAPGNDTSFSVWSGSPV